MITPTVHEILEQVVEEIAQRTAAILAERDQPEEDPLPQFLDAETIAGQLGVTSKTVRNMWANGSLPSLKIGGSRKTEAAALAAYIDQQRRAG